MKKVNTNCEVVVPVLSSTTAEEIPAEAQGVLDLLDEVVNELGLDQVWQMKPLLNVCNYAYPSSLHVWSILLSCSLFLSFPLLLILSSRVKKCRMQPTAQEVLPLVKR